MAVFKDLEDKICLLDRSIAELQEENIKLKKENEALLMRCKAVETQYAVDPKHRSKENEKTRQAVDDLIKSIDLLIDSELCE